MGNSLIELQHFGQSAWCDYIEREGLMAGNIKKMVEAGEVTGITSNPTIFDKAISGSITYDTAISQYLTRNPDSSVNDLYEALAIEDIRMATGLLRPVFDRTGGTDGYVSLEVSPYLAHDTERTLREARRLFHTVDRPNLMIKVPATQEGLPAIRQLIGEGLNINVTLMFSLQQYIDVVASYMSGLEHLAESGGDVSKVASVASFFVSRVDTAVDKQLPEDSSLRGRIAVANAQVAYARFRKTITQTRWKELEKKGAKVQRVLWGSTSTKNPAYSDVLYVEELIGSDTVNTIPPVTIDAFRDHGKPGLTLTDDDTKALEVLDRLKEHGIDLDHVTAQLTEEGVQSFSKSFDSLMETLTKKKALMTV